MPKITKIYPMDANPPRYPEASVLVYIDGVKCRAVRQRTWSAMNLKVGDQITCAELNEREAFHWKHVYGKAAWDQEKVRLEKVKNLLESFDPRVFAKVIGFGADSSDFIAAHPDEAGKPDIEIVTRSGGIHVLYVEVTGTTKMRGDTYWVRPDKLAYVKNHSDQDVWLILHYAEPNEKFVFIKPDNSRTYEAVEKVIRGSTECYVEFSNDAPEVVPQPEFVAMLLSKVNALI